MNKITLVLRAVPPSLNRFAGRENTHEYRNLKAEWTSRVMFNGCIVRPEQPFDKSVVTITYRFKDRRRRDPDNYQGKLLLDGLTKAGIIADDSFDHIRLVLQAEPEPGEPRTTIEIQEI